MNKLVDSSWRTVDGKKLGRFAVIKMPDARCQMPEDILGGNC